MTKIITMYGATWCQPCKRTKPLIEKISNDLHVALNYIDVANLTPEELKESNVSSVPVIVIHENGEETHRHIGAITAQQLTDLLE